MDMILKTTDLCKNFKGQMAVNNVSLNIRRNSVYGLLGPNGAGKSTILKMLTGITFLQKGFPAPPKLLFYTNPLRAAMSSATMDTAISSGVSAPISRPMGLWTRPKSSSEKPSERRKL